MAAILIVVYHFAADKPAFLQLGGFERVLYIAPTFVSYFFLLSGFILVVADSKAVWLQRAPSSPKFWLNRFARIYPLFALAVLVSIPNFREQQGTYPTAPALLTNLLLFQAWIPLRSFAINFPDWSLSCEAFFYLLFPFILKTLLALRSQVIATVVVLSYAINLAIHIVLVDWGVAQGLVFTDHWFHDFIFHLPLTHFTTFISGVGFGIIFVRNYEVLRSQKTYWGWLAIGSGLLWIGLVVTKQPLLLYHHNGLFAPLYLLMLAGLCLSSGWLIRILASRPLGWLGEISYGIYILQLPVYWFVRIPGLPKLGGLGLSSMYIYLPPLIIVAGLCNRFVETPAKIKIRALYKRFVASPAGI